jgi:hypothetical protein
MRLSVDICVFVLIMSLCVLVSSAGAAARAEARADSPGLGHEEAVVTRIESDRVVLRSTSAENREFSVSREKYGGLRIGDRVVVVGNTVKKVGETSNPDRGISTPGAGTAEGVTGAPDHAPATGGSTTGP